MQFAFRPVIAPIPSLYPRRERATNVALIKALLAADSDESFARADLAAGSALHPSLLAEMDWMEATMPDRRRDAGRRFVDGFFMQHLPTILAQRRAEFELDDEDLRPEVAESIDFYRGALADDRRPLHALGNELSERISAIAATVSGPIVDGVDRRLAALQPAIDDLFADVRDPDWVPLLVQRELRNALAWTLDHPATRMRAQSWMRGPGANLFTRDWPSVATINGLDRLVANMREVEGSASSVHLFDIAALCRAIGDSLARTTASAFDRFDGELCMGYGNCGRCAMMYASTAICCFDPTCPGLFETGTYTIQLPLAFNVSVCTFCGEQSRDEAPSLFYAPHRDQVIYLFPRLGQFSEEEARQVHRPSVQALRERLIVRLGRDAAARFEAAGEEITYSAATFLLAVQMGTTVQEYHAYILCRLFDGTGLVVDPAKGVMLDLTPAELASRWASALPPPAMERDSAAASPDGSGGLAEAMQAFAAGDAARARDILAPIFRANPGDEIISKNFAAALLTLGDREAARRVLRGEREWASKT